MRARLLSGFCPLPPLTLSALFPGKTRASIRFGGGKKKRGKKEKNSDRPIPRKLFRRLPFLNAIHSVNKKEERLDTMVAGYYLLANYTWARSGENFRPGYNKPSYPSSLPPPPPSLPPFLSIHLTPLRRTYFQPVQLLDRLEPCLLWPPCTTCMCNVRQHLLHSPPPLAV